MEIALVVTRVVHVAVAAAWFGHKLLIPADLRHATRGMTGPDPQLVTRIRRSQRLGIATGLGTLATGAFLVALIGQNVVPFRIYIGLGLVLVMFLVGSIMARPAWATLKVSLEEGTRTTATSAARRLGRALNIESILWVAALITMVV